ncbi:hypothetical protein LIA77_08690 [Sarocladium implicatum]|nr:hypothetical protein LIA77_08690 [Sarocladium implicatum]
MTTTGDILRAGGGRLFTRSYVNYASALAGGGGVVHYPHRVTLTDGPWMDVLTLEHEGHEQDSYFSQLQLYVRHWNSFMHECHFIRWGAIQKKQRGSLLPATLTSQSTARAPGIIWVSRSALLS